MPTYKDGISCEIKKGEFNIEDTCSIEGAALGTGKLGNDVVREQSTYTHVSS